MLRSKFFPFLTLGIICFTLTSAGCSSKQPPLPDAKNTELMQVGELYSMYIKQNQKPPTKPSDLRSMEAIYGGPVQAINRGDVLVSWGTPNGDGNVIIAVEKAGPQSGGWALFGDGSVKQVSAADVGAKFKEVKAKK